MAQQAQRFYSTFNMSLQAQRFYFAFNMALPAQRFSTNNILNSFKLTRCNYQHECYCSEVVCGNFVVEYLSLSVTSVPKCKRKRERDDVALSDQDSVSAPPAPT